MTVVLAVRCAEGVILGSDGQSTDTSAGNLATATRSTVQKLFPLGSHIAFGATGSGGVIQRFAHLCSTVGNVDVSSDVEELRGTLAGFQRGLQQQVRGEVIEGFAGQQVPTFGVLFAGYTGGEPWILEVTPGGEDTVYDHFYAVGSGGTFAQMAMASVAHYDLPSRNLAEAHVIVWRALEACIDAAAFGLGRPIWLYSVTADGAQQLTDDDLRGVGDAVNAWKEAERESLIGLGLGAPIPEPAPETEVGIDPDGGGLPAAGL